MKAKITLATALAAMLSIAGATAVVAQGDPSPKEQAEAAIGYTIAPPNVELDGRSRTDLVKEYFAWYFLDATVATHPGVQRDCMVRQPAGDVFFLPHATHGSLAQYDCTIRSDQHVLAWLGGPLCFVAPGEPPGAAAEFCASSVGHVNPELTIDGQTTPISGGYWLDTGEYTVDLAEDNFFGFPPGERGVGAAGWWVLIEPLPVGEHTIMTRNDLYDPGSSFREPEENQCGTSTCTARALMNVTVVDAGSAS